MAVGSKGWPLLLWEDQPTTPQRCMNSIHIHFFCLSHEASQFCISYEVSQIISFEAFQSLPHLTYASYLAVLLQCDITSPPDPFTPSLPHHHHPLPQTCKKYGLDKSSETYQPNAWEFLINKKHNLVWCNVFKAASSTWFYNFNLLAGYSEYELLHTKESPVNLARKRYDRCVKQF